MCQLDSNVCVWVCGCVGVWVWKRERERVYACVYVYVHMYNVKNKLALEGCQPCFRDMGRRRGGRGVLVHTKRRQNKRDGVATIRSLLQKRPVRETICCKRDV